MSAHPAILQALQNGGADMVADSRILNLQSVSNVGLKMPIMLLRLPAPSRAAACGRRFETKRDAGAANATCQAKNA